MGVVKNMAHVNNANEEEYQADYSLYSYNISVL